MSPERGSLRRSIYDLPDSLVMGIDPVGTFLERGESDPVTVGGRAEWRFRARMEAHLPADYEPGLRQTERIKRYFQAQGFELARANVYAGVVATFCSWFLMPVILPLNLFRLARQRRPPSNRGA